MKLLIQFAYPNVLLVRQIENKSCFLEKGQGLRNNPFDAIQLEPESPISRAIGFGLDGLINYMRNNQNSYAKVRREAIKYRNKFKIFREFVWHERTARA